MTITAGAAGRYGESARHRGGDGRRSRARRGTAGASGDAGTGGTAGATGDAGTGGASSARPATRAPTARRARAATRGGAADAGADSSAISARRRLRSIGLDVPRRASSAHDRVRSYDGSAKAAEQRHRRRHEHALSTTLASTRAPSGPRERRARLRGARIDHRPHALREGRDRLPEHVPRRILDGRNDVRRVHAAGGGSRRDHPHHPLPRPDHPARRSSHPDRQERALVVDQRNRTPTDCTSP